MIDVRSKKCITCNLKHLIFNYPNEQNPLYCKYCKSCGMIDIKHEKCITCNKVRAYFNCPHYNVEIVKHVV